MAYKKKIIIFSYTFIFVLTVIGVFNFSIDSYNLHYSDQENYDFALIKFQKNDIIS